MIPFTDSWWLILDSIGFYKAHETQPMNSQGHQYLLTQQAAAN